MSGDPSSPSDRQDHPSRIGPFKILQLLGEGGMGVVYEAEQDSPIHRRVALKVIRAGLDSKPIVARFEAERQALAVMDHPNIAKIFESGATEEGRPFFAMELVRGVPITNYCDSWKLSTEERLRLFGQVCRAVQHAHHKGVIHRDLKPSNILVTSVDGQAVPKIIDFGIAKALGHELTETTLVTELGQVFGTPDYVSPEQVEPTGLDIDTRTDVYSLGVVLYELLVGARPLELRGLARYAAWQAIRERTPPTPSSRLSTFPGATQQTVASYRRTDPQDLRRTLRGDLDWVAMRCLEKDRTRRYETANGLARDVERYLRHEPVDARPPSAAYRMKKFVRRHRAGVAAIVVALLGVAAGSGAALVNMVRAQRAEARALEEATLASEVSGFLVGLFQLATPGGVPDGEQGKPVTARELLDRGSERIETELAGHPIAQAQLLETIGEVYYHLGDFDEAIRLFERGLEIHEREQGPDHLDVAEILVELGNTNLRLANYERAESTIRRSLQIREQALGPDHLDVMENLDLLARLHLTQANYDEATEIYERVLRLRRASLDPDDMKLALSLNELARAYALQARTEEAERHFREALAIYERALGPEHPYVAAVTKNLGSSLVALKRYDEAEPLLRRALAIEARTLDPNHAQVAASHFQLGRFYEDQDRLDEAESSYRRAADILEKSLGPEHPQLAVGLAQHANVLNRLGRHAEAETLSRRALSIWAASLGEEHPSQAFGRLVLANALAGQRRYADAEALYNEALRLGEVAWKENQPRLAEVLENLAAVLRETGRPGEAEPLEARARAMRQQADAAPAGASGSGMTE